MITDRSKLQVRFLRFEEYERWDAMVTALPTATIFAESRWLTAVAEIMACDVRIAAVFSDDRLLAGAPVRISRRFGMSMAAGLPLTPTNSCIITTGPNAYPAKITSRLLTITDALARFLQSHFDYVILTFDPELQDIRSFNWLDWRSQALYTYHVDIVKADLAALPRTLRYDIRHAEKTGMTSEVSRDFLLGHAPIAKTFARKGVPLPLAAEQLAAFGERLGEDLLLLLARSHDGRLIASDIILLDRPRKIAYVLLAGCDTAAKCPGAAFLLQWQSFIHCRELGIEIIDQVGAENKEIATFKAELGGRLVPYFQVSKAGLRYRLVNRLAMIGERALGR
ncbi:MAG: hypothetical protein A2512_10830 [Deltaproteobacteria bacterium RIFOXYD12_FULL_56_24]|nr:MAG: hypothetical protein A2512_10830 [Deltaproteobacteria bacterium RIFOXYD12_FULL_56_24]